MTTAIYLIISGALIGAGISIIWRDVRARRRAAFVSDRDHRLAEDRRAADADVEITIAHGAEPASAQHGSAAPAYQHGSSLRSVLELHASGLQRHAESLPSPRRERERHVVPPASSPSPSTLPDEERPGAAPDGEPRQGARLALEQQWSALQPAVAAGVERTNAVLAPVGLLIGPVGEPSWSYKHKAYGAYRRLLLSGESLAWLRLELFTDGRLRTGVRAHREDRASLNATAEAPAAGFDAEAAFALVSRCLQPAAAYATREKRDSDERASEAAWQSVDALVAAALKATNGALAQAGARLIALAPAAWESGLRRHRMALSVEVNGDDVARMHIERLPHEMEVAVGVREPQFADLGRRRRIPIDGMTIHNLAELIASCAWPVIARFRETRREA
jgi:hypothetical protein